VPSPPPTASAGSPGREIVRFPGIGIKGGVVHATAVTGQFAWCQAQKWGPSGGAETAVVRCYLQGGGPAFAPFTVMFSASSGAVAGAGLRYTYMHDTDAAVSASDNSTGDVNTVTTLGPGESLTYRSGRAVTGAAPRLHACPLNNQPRVAGPYAPVPSGSALVRRADGGP
jgi:hypothetical protein